jgi:hypothetical protein
MPRTGHILNAASNLLGIALLIIAGLHIANQSEKTFADEVAWIAAICFASSCFLSYLSIRNDTETVRLERWADAVFMIGMIALFGSVVVLAVFKV